MHYYIHNKHACIIADREEQSALADSGIMVISTKNKIYIQHDQIKMGQFVLICLDIAVLIVGTVSFSNYHSTIHASSKILLQRNNEMFLLSKSCYVLIFAL